MFLTTVLCFMPWITGAGNGETVFDATDTVVYGNDPDDGEFYAGDAEPDDQGGQNDQYNESKHYYEHTYSQPDTAGKKSEIQNYEKSEAQKDTTKKSYGRFSYRLKSSKSSTGSSGKKSSSGSKKSLQSGQSNTSSAAAFTIPAGWQDEGRYEADVDIEEGEYFLLPKDTGLGASFTIQGNASEPVVVKNFKFGLYLEIEKNQTVTFSNCIFIAAKNKNRSIKIPDIKTAYKLGKDLEVGTYLNAHSTMIQIEIYRRPTYRETDMTNRFIVAGGKTFELKAADSGSYVYTNSSLPLIKVN